MSKFVQLCYQLAEAVIEVGDAIITDSEKEKSRDATEAMNFAKSRAVKVVTKKENLLDV